MAKKDQEKLRNKEHAIKCLQEAGITWRVKNNGSMFAIREQGKPPIDLYPTTKKWKKAGAKAVEGEIEEFIEWYLVQDINSPKTSKPILPKKEKAKKNESKKGLSKEDLTEEQLQAFNEIMEFIQVSSEQEHVLIGSAGCGKTATLKVILDEIGDSLDVVCTAPTNAAVKVIAEATGRAYDKTIYSLLGLKIVHYDDKESKLEASGESKASKLNIIVIDEASMISDELYQVIKEEVEAYSYLKVLYIGDDAQLPPVDDEGRESPVFNIKNKSILKTIMRTENGNPILENLSVIRSNVKKIQEYVKPLYEEDPDFRITPQLNHHLISLESPIDKSTRRSEDGKVGIIYHDRSQFYEMMEEALDEFASDEYEENKNHVRLLAYTNKTVNFLNNKVRARIFSDNDEIEEYMPGEDLIVASPITVKDKDDNDEILYTTGERLLVKKANIREYFDRTSGVKFLYWDLLVDNYEAIMSQRSTEWIKVVCTDSPTSHEQQYPNSYDFNFKIQNYERYSTTAFNFIKSKLAKKCRNRLSPGINKRTVWKPFFDFINEFSKVTYSYATTCHRAQGATFTNTYVIGDDLDKLTWDRLQLNKLRYVAMSRSSHKLHVLSS